jgi:hypothetical protein
MYLFLAGQVTFLSAIIIYDEVLTGYFLNLEVTFENVSNIQKV